MGYADNVQPNSGEPYALANETQLLVRDLSSRLGVYQGAEITVSQSDDVDTITVQLTDYNGNPVTQICGLTIMLVSTSAGGAWASNPSTGFAATTGAIDADVTKLTFEAVTNASGVLVLTYTDTTSPGVTAFLAVILPNGDLVVSTALTTP